jgi:hypothetical protein
MKSYLVTDNAYNTLGRKNLQTLRVSQKLHTVLKVTFSSYEILENLGQPDYFLQ